MAAAGSNTEESTEESKFTPYERGRQQQIAQNQAVLRGLGLAAPSNAERPARRSRRPRATAPTRHRSTRVAPHDSGRFAQMHLFGRSLDDWPLPLPPAYSKLARARRQAAAALARGDRDEPSASASPAEPAPRAPSAAPSRNTAER